MNKRPKFQMWVPSLNTMYPHEMINFSDLFNLEEDPEDFFLRQFSNWVDKDEAEIYAGDIMDYGEEWEEKEKVICESGIFSALEDGCIHVTVSGFCFVKIKDQSIMAWMYTTHDMKNVNQITSMKKIGNKYQNPELLII